MNVIRDELDRLRLSVGRIEAAHHDVVVAESLRQAEFSVFSQWGADGIIQYLLRSTAVGPEVFIEFGVADYRESNTRFLMANNGWSGLLIDNGTQHVEFLAQSSLSWRHSVQAVQAVVTPENVNELFRRSGLIGDIGLLSIDIDGNDYWVFEAIDAVSPRIVVLEYNSVLGAEHALTIPYTPGFNYETAHFSGLYYGASLQALTLLASAKGYCFVGCESSGCNAFFVRRDVMDRIEECSIQDGYVASRFQTGRDAAGQPLYLGNHRERLEMIKGMPMYDVVSGCLTMVGDVFNLR